MTTTYELPNHRHKDGTVHSHDGGHTSHYHMVDGPDGKPVSEHGAAASEQYDVPKYAVQFDNPKSHKMEQPCFCTSIVWDSGYLRYTPARRSPDEPRSTFVCPYSQVMWVEELS